MQDIERAASLDRLGTCMEATGFRFSIEELGSRIWG